MPQTKIKPLLLRATWSAPANIHTLISTSYHDFNLALHVGADPDLVAQNRAQLRQLLPSNARWLNQSHSIDVIDWDSHPHSNLINADGALTRQKKLVCTVMTADCLPILLTNQAGDFVAAVHAGWRGLNDGILAQTMQKLAPFKPQTMLAFIGPAICQSCFEIGTEVYQSFSAKDPGCALHFTPSATAGKFKANLRAIAAQQLKDLGIVTANISNNNICTRCHPKWFYSYRGNPACGRMACLIWRD